MDRKIRLNERDRLRSGRQTEGASNGRREAAQASSICSREEKEAGEERAS
jgi:hypothetical protein